jgi:hypothetical protein
LCAWKFEILLNIDIIKHGKNQFSMQAGPSGDALNTLYGQPRYKDKIVQKCVLLGMELRILFNIDEQ